MSTIQIITFFGHIWAKITKNAISGHKNGQKYQLQVGFMRDDHHYARCKAYTLVNSLKKLFLKLDDFTTYFSPQSVYTKHIYCVFSEVAKKFKMQLPNFKYFYIFAKLCICSLTYILKLARE